MGNNAAMTVEVRRMYRNGPLRMFSQQAFLGAVPYRGGDLVGYAGQYVCSACGLPVPRVLYTMALGDWTCRDCDSAWRRAATAASKYADG